FTMLTPCGVPILDLAGVNPALVLQELDAFAAGSRWIVDAILGVGAVGVPRPPCDTLIDWMNGEPARRLAVDVPSGLDADTGEPASPTVRADVTATFVAPKAGFANHTVAEWLGEVRVLGIGAPSR
ncbi:MAG: NAD(P)H-hydrate epimerase, partial [Planctomycetota bacterium]